MRKGMIVLILIFALTLLPFAAEAATPHNGHNGNGHNGHNNWNNARHFGGAREKIVFLQAPIDCVEDVEYVTIGNAVYKITNPACNNGIVKMVKLI